MKKLSTILFLLFTCYCINGQVVFKTIVPQEPVVAGESFRVQYVAEGADRVVNLSTPSFKGFRLVSGPEIYNGQTSYQSNALSIHNTIYTLKALTPGRFVIPGALASINDKPKKSNDEWIEVISEAAAMQRNLQNGNSGEQAASYLKYGENPADKIRQNMFVKVDVDRNTCYTGQPVVATFKLFSRLQSRSDIVKNPGFYGFTVQDMVSLTDNMVNKETVNGKQFDVHTLRKVQLYPLQAGVFSIDAMEIKSRIEFTRNSSGKKAEQLVTEGLFDKEDKIAANDSLVFDNAMHTDAVKIVVKPLPIHNKPADYNGAVGHFNIITTIEKNELARNEEGFLVVTLKGRGNFNQLSAPVVRWPQGIEGFEPVIIDSLDKMAVPLSGTKVFRYPFVASAAGEYTIAPTGFTFFDPDSNKYKTILNASQTVKVFNKEKVNEVVKQQRTSLSSINRRVSIIAAGIVILFVIIMVTYWLTRKKEVKATVEEIKPSLPSADEILQPVYLLLSVADKDFYKCLHQSIWQYLSQRFGLMGSDMNKQMLIHKLMEEDKVSASELPAILEQCEAGMYSNASLGEDREILLQKVKEILAGL